MEQDSLSNYFFIFRNIYCALLITGLDGPRGLFNLNYFIPTSSAFSLLFNCAGIHSTCSTQALQNQSKSMFYFNSRNITSSQEVQHLHTSFSAASSAQATFPPCHPIQCTALLLLLWPVWPRSKMTPLRTSCDLPSFCKEMTQGPVVTRATNKPHSL